MTDADPDAVEMHDRSAGPSVTELIPRPLAWNTLAQALSERRPVLACYHGQQRLLCPHVLGWTKRRAKMLAYQAAGGTSAGSLPAAAKQRWRSMFIDEIEDPVITDGCWESAQNYCDEPDRLGMDRIEVRVAARVEASGLRSRA